MCLFRVSPITRVRALATRPPEIRAKNWQNISIFEAKKQGLVIKCDNPNCEWFINLLTCLTVYIKQTIHIAWCCVYNFVYLLSSHSLGSRPSSYKNMAGTVFKDNKKNHSLHFILQSFFRTVIRKIFFSFKNFTYFLTRKIDRD